MRDKLEATNHNFFAYFKPNLQQTAKKRKNAKNFVNI